MILDGNLPGLIETCRSAERVLGVGGWHNPFNLATHVIDSGAYATRQTAETVTPGEPERFDQASWTVQDLCTPDWPYPDKFFDFAICSHLLEDVRDPLVVCAELVRVARRGYIEVPSRTREIFAKARFFRLRALLGHVPEIGFYHHRWMCEIEGSHMRFLRKSHQLAMDRAFFLTRAEVGRKLSEEESGICLWWDDSFSVEEVFEVSDEDLRRFKAGRLRELRKTPAFSLFGPAARIRPRGR